MEKFERPLHLRWSDLDPINHVRHSVYYDMAAQVRTELFLENDIRLQEMAERGFGPVLFEEKATFRRELRYGDPLIMNAAVLSLRKDYSRFRFLHEIWREEERCATVEVYGAWIDLNKRKLTIPPEDFLAKLRELPLAPDFRWEEKSPDSQGSGK